MVQSKSRFTFVLSSTEKAGRFTLPGNSSEWHGRMSQVFPDKATISLAKSYHEHTPSLENGKFPDVACIFPFRWRERSKWPSRRHKSAFPPGQIRHSTAPFPLSNAVWSLQNYSRKQNTASRLISFPNYPLAPVTNILFIEIHIIVKPITGIFQAWMVSVLFRKDHLSGRNPPVDS